MLELRKIAGGFSPDLDVVLTTSDGFHVQDSNAKARDAFLSLWDAQCPQNGNKRAIITCLWVEADSKKRSHDAAATSGDTHDTPSHKRRMMTAPELVDSPTYSDRVDVVAGEENAIIERQDTKLPPFEREHHSGSHVHNDSRRADHHNYGYTHQYDGLPGSLTDCGGRSGFSQVSHGTTRGHIGRGGLSHMSRGGSSHSQGDRGGSLQAHNGHGHGGLDYEVGQTFDPHIARSKPPFFLKITVPAQEESNIKTGTTLTSLLRQALDNARCANCGHYGHRLIDCVFPDIGGKIKGCWLCNDKSHDWCECNHPLKDTLTWSDIYDVMIGDRGGKPSFRMPFSIFDMVWKLRCQSHHSTRYDGQHGPFPLSCKFVKKMLTGKIKDADGKVVKIWQTYNYSTDEGLVNRRCHLMPDLRTDTYDKLLVYRDDLEKDAVAPKGWVRPHKYFETDWEDSSATYGAYRHRAEV